MPTKRQAGLLTLYSIGHFFVDFACALGMLSLVTQGETEGLLCFLLYNFCAFALQMPVGLIADKLDRNGALGVCGFALTLLAFPAHALPLLSAVMLGVGNCLFHVGGGVDVLHFSEEKQWMLGVYVSPGAIGLFLGGMLAKVPSALPIGGVVLLLLMAVISCCIHLCRPLHKPSGNVPPSIRPVGRAPAVAVILLMLVVVMRSYVGLTLSFPWKTGVLATLAVLGLAFGKTAGGFLADRFGALRVSAVSLALASVLFLFSSNAICGILAIFLFNMTMPLTLFAVARLFPGARGFAFGLLTFALFLGYLPAQLSQVAPFSGEGWWYAVQAAVSLILLVVGLIACRHRGGGEDV